MTSAGSRIAGFAADFHKVELPDRLRHTVYRAVLDTLAVAVAGRRDEVVHIARQYLNSELGTGEATAWTTGEALPVERAAWLNGVVAHVLDYDDMLPPMRGHPSVAMLPALIALAQAKRANGRQLSTAYIAGFEVLTKIAKVIGVQQNTLGWHATATLGILGATVACCVLLGLNQRQIVHALGLAVTQAAGNRENFGTMAKCFQVGQANAGAVRAALLAQAGFDAPASAIDGKYGYMALYAGREDLSTSLQTVGQGPLEIDAVSIDVKKFPCGYAIHRTLDGVLSLREKHQLTMDAVESIDIVTNARNLEPLRYTRPQTELEAKFSLEYPAAAALLDGKIGLMTFSDKNVLRSEIKAFLPRISKCEGPGEMLPRWADVTIKLKNGAVVTEHVTSSRGDAQNPLSDEELIAKAQDCILYGGCTWQVAPWAQKIFAMSNMYVGDVLPGPE